MNYTKDKSIRNKIVKRFSVIITAIIMVTSMPLEVYANDANIYHLGEVVNAGKDTGFSKKKEITKKDPHFNWILGEFSVSGFSRVITEEDTTVFLKTVGDKVTLNFKLEQDINALNSDETLVIANDKKAYDNELYKEETAFGRGALIVRKTDAYQNKKGESQLYVDYLAGVKAGANTQVEICEEGDYEVALDYSVRDKKITLPFVNKTIRSTYNDYRIYFKFSVRNGNCMVFPFDVETGEELTNKSITENGFYLDLAKSRYLDINVKKEVLHEGATGLTEDVRFNKPASDGEKYTEEGIYTITVLNQYTGEETVKKIYVGTDSVLKAHMMTGYSIGDIQTLIQNGATIDKEGKITVQEQIEMPEVVESMSNSAIVLNEAEDIMEVEKDILAEENVKIEKSEENISDTRGIVLGSICFVFIVFIISLLFKRKKKEEALGEVPENDPEEMDKSNDEELALEESLGEDKEQ